MKPISSIVVELTRDALPRDTHRHICRCCRVPLEKTLCLFFQCQCDILLSQSGCFSYITTTTTAGLFFEHHFDILDYRWGSGSLSFWENFWVLLSKTEFFHFFYLVNQFRYIEFLTKLDEFFWEKWLSFWKKLSFFGLSFFENAQTKSLTYILFNSESSSEWKITFFMSKHFGNKLCLESKLQSYKDV